MQNDWDTRALDESAFYTIVTINEKAHTKTELKGQCFKILIILFVVFLFVTLIHVTCQLTSSEISILFLGLLLFFPSSHISAYLITLFRLYDQSVWQWCHLSLAIGLIKVNKQKSHFPILKGYVISLTVVFAWYRVYQLVLVKINFKVLLNLYLHFQALEKPKIPWNSKKLKISDSVDSGFSIRTWRSWPCPIYQHI